MADQAIKESLVCAVDVLKLTSQALSGFSLEEIAIALQAVKDFVIAAKDFGKVIPEYISLTDADRADLKAYVEASVKFPADANVELYIKKGLDLLILVSGILQ